jgi:hypothetical protein
VTGVASVTVHQGGFRVLQRIGDALVRGRAQDVQEPEPLFAAGQPVRVDAADRRAIDDHIVLVVPRARLPALDGVVGALGSQEKLDSPIENEVGTRIKAIEKETLNPLAA